MSELVDLDAKRKAKASKCDFCGQPDHRAPFLCPRVSSVTYEGEAVTVELWPIEPTVSPPEAA